MQELLGKEVEEDGECDITEHPKPFPSQKDLRQVVEFLRAEGMDTLIDLVIAELDARKAFVAWLQDEREKSCEPKKLAVIYIKDVLEAFRS